MSNRYATAAAAVKAALQDNVNIVSSEFVGSGYIIDCTNGDVDVLVLVDRHPDDLRFEGWVYGGSGSDYHDQWGSWKRIVDGVEVNMLLTNDADYYRAWCTAAEVCRFLHLSGVVVDKSRRIAIHNIIMDDSAAVSEQAALDAREYYR